MLIVNFNICFPARLFMFMIFYHQDIHDCGKYIPHGVPPQLLRINKFPYDISQVFFILATSQILNLLEYSNEICNWCCFIW